ncbi:hypothetical protein AQUCO_04300131v1 [Aquilegia coerulea]|uniref:Uncharacterized protein n=2 Tax=Aquilegia coerulea TaxID=218851 RepID=A0A2G5CNV7_AQUCA|nr:hypothetical protein AQUCO_04300131v1 [Aquilegia coerulea]
MLSIDLEELLEYEQLGVNLGDIFEQARGTDYIFEVKMSTYQDNMSLAINRTKVIHSIPDDDGPLDNEANNDDPPSFGMVSIKQEKDDDELQSNPQAYNDDDGNKHKVVTKTVIHDIQDDDENKTDIALSFRMVTIKQEKNDDERQPNCEVDSDDDDGINLALMKKRVSKEKKPTKTTKEGNKVSPAKKMRIKEN